MHRGPATPPGRALELVPRPAPRATRQPAATVRPASAAHRFELDPQRFPTLCALGKNLTLAAAIGELEPVVGRDSEVEQTRDVLAKRHGNSPCLVGGSGVGKTSVVRALAARVARAERLAPPDDRIIVEIPVAGLIAGTSLRGALAERIAGLRKEVGAAADRVVLFFDEIHQLFVAEAAEELAAELKPSLASGELPCIGATTPEEYRRTIEADPALARRFTRVDIEEPSREDAFLIVDAASQRLGSHHRVRYLPEALAMSVNWSARYLPNQSLPDKAISVADLAGARVRRRNQTEVAVETIAEVVAELADLPVERLLQADGDRMLRLEQLLQGQVFGHDEQLAAIARIVRRNAAGLGAQRPLGTFLLLGPTGVGKTETAKALAAVLFHSPGAMTRIDLSEYGQPHSVARLLGSPPGYVGHEAGGQLTEAVRRRPHQVILLDEVEKAHPEVLVAFLPVFDEGRLTDGRGRSADFTNTIILMTSNLGAEESGSAARRRVGFGAEAAPPSAQVERGVVAAARKALAPELYNRIDEVLVFSALSRSDVGRIARRLLFDVGRTLQLQHGICLEVDDEAIQHLLDHGGFDPALGARPMRRAIARLVEAPLAERILSGDLRRGDVALLTVLDNELQLDALDGTPEAVSSPLN
jgi:ATP-dependent Clp protease ATP-binding subunit ClpC